MEPDIEGLIVANKEMKYFVECLTSANVCGDGRKR